MLRLLIAIVALVAAAWIASYATGRGVLVLSQHLMSAQVYADSLPPGATDTPVGRVCTYLRYDFIRQQWLVDRAVWDDAPRPVNDARPIGSWVDETCPLFSEGLS